MKAKLLAISLILLLTVAPLMLVVPTRAAGETHWITSYTVEDATTGQKLVEADFTVSDEPTVLSPVVSGEDLIVTFTVNVIVGGSGNLKLSSYMQKPSSGIYWELIPGDYDLGSGYTPGTSSMEFNWEQGTFEMIAYGSARKVTSAAINSTLVQLSGATGDVLDAVKVDIFTAGASEFQSLYDQKESKLQGLIDSGVDAGYTTLYGNMLNQSKALVAKGYVNEAIALLNAIPSTGEPIGSAFQMIMLPAIGVAAAGAVVFAFLFLRARGKNSYTQMVIEDQIKDLEGLTLRASKIDRTIASNLDSVKDRLKRLVGM